MVNFKNFSKAYEDLVRAHEICKIDLECAVNEEKILLKELSHMRSMLKELEPLYDELEKTTELLSKQPQNGKMHHMICNYFFSSPFVLEGPEFRKKIEEVEREIKFLEEVSYVVPHGYSQFV